MEKTTKASIISKYDFGQKVWFLIGRNIVSGTIIEINGRHNYLYSYSKIELGIQEGDSGLSLTSTVNERDCFSSREELVESILKSDSNRKSS